jgi:hypothetical protein
MFDRFAVCLSFAAACVIALAPATAAPPKKAEPVSIEGYDGEAMEPFVSRDGRFLFFNTRNDPGTNTNIHFAEANGAAFTYRGLLFGTISHALDAVPTMAADGRFCFVSPRDYRRTRVSVICGTFDGKKVERVAAQATLATERIGRLVFDVELSADGRTMLFAEGTFSGGELPDEADLYLATLTPRGYERAPDSAKLFANINTTGTLEYAPALSPDGLELYFTRLTNIWPFNGPKIFRARRASVDEPFGKPERVLFNGFVEAISFGADGALYFHKRVSDRYKIWRLPK